MGIILLFKQMRVSTVIAALMATASAEAGKAAAGATCSQTKENSGCADGLVCAKSDTTVGGMAITVEVCTDRDACEELEGNEDKVAGQTGSVNIAKITCDAMKVASAAALVAT